MKNSFLHTDGSAVSFSVIIFNKLRKILGLESKVQLPIKFDYITEVMTRSCLQFNNFLCWSGMLTYHA